MKLAAFIYAGALSPQALESINGGASALQRCLEFVGRLPGLERTVIAEGKLVLPEMKLSPAGRALTIVRREDWNLDSLLAEMAAAGQEVDAVLLAWADEPFLDSALAAKMLEDFRRYRAEYGFADGYPLGLAAEIVSPRVLPAIRRLAAALSPEIGRGSLFAAIQKDINAFDIETDISPVDLRDLRLELACDTKRNRLLVESLAQAGVVDAASALKAIPEHPGLLRTLPAFVQVQIASGCPQSCRLCAYPDFGGDILSLRRDMPRGRFAGLLDQVVELCGDAVIDISMWGEPAMHSDIGGIIEEVFGQLAKPGSRLAAYISATGSAGTIAAGDYLRKKFPLLKVVATEALQCPTLLSNGFGSHRIEGIGDKHVPWVHNVRNTDMVAAIDDEQCMSLLRLFNEEVGSSYLERRGLKRAFVDMLPQVGISGICNVVAAIKTAKYLELDGRDILLTPLTDSMALYGSRIQELREERGAYTTERAAQDFARYLEGTGIDYLQELTYRDRKRLHNLKYFTWVEQQGKTVQELDELWEPDGWNEVWAEIGEWDRLIEEFNRRTGVLQTLD